MMHHLIKKTTVKIIANRKKQNGFTAAIFN